MADIRRVCPDEWKLLREVRLTALRESPRAFGSTYKRESAYTEADWRSRLTTAVWFVARVNARLVGVVASRRRDNTESRRELLSMWMHPDQRGTGVAAELVCAVQTRARSDGASVLTLSVADGNDRARRFYEKLGFVSTGVRMPLPNNPGIDATEFSYTL